MCTPFDVRSLFFFFAKRQVVRPMGRAITGIVVSELRQLVRPLLACAAGGVERTRRATIGGEEVSKNYKSSHLRLASITTTVGS